MEPAASFCPPVRAVIAGPAQERDDALSDVSSDEVSGVVEHCSRTKRDGDSHPPTVVDENRSRSSQMERGGEENAGYEENPQMPHCAYGSGNYDGPMERGGEENVGFWDMVSEYQSSRTVEAKRQAAGVGVRSTVFRAILGHGRVPGGGGTAESPAEVTQRLGRDASAGPPAAFSACAAREAAGRHRVRVYARCRSGCGARRHQQQAGGGGGSGARHG